MRKIFCFVLSAVLFTAVFSVSGCQGTSGSLNSDPSSTPFASPLPPSPSVFSTPLPSPSKTPEPTEPPYEGQEIADYAMRFLGFDYNYGGQDPSTGFDCSGLVYYIFRQFGYRLNRVAEDQARNGSAIDSIEDLLPGDIICFSYGSSSYINHVGIYLGNGEFIHAMDSANDVTVTELADYLKTHSFKARRIIGAVEKMTEAEIQATDRRDREIADELERLRIEKEQQEAEEARLQEQLRLEELARASQVVENSEAENESSEERPEPYDPEPERGVGTGEGEYVPPEPEMIDGVLTIY